MIAVLEGLLYIQGDMGLTIEQVMDVFNISFDDAKKLIYELKNIYDNDDNRGLRINYLGNTFKLTTKVEHKEFYKNFFEDTKKDVLSNSALEVLAIIAYNEPITRVDIDKLRGVESVYLLRRLIARGLIKECGRSELPGRPILYKTTDEFLDCFGLATKDDLPKIIMDDCDKEDIEKDLFKSRYTEEN